MPDNNTEDNTLQSIFEKAAHIRMLLPLIAAQDAQRNLNHETNKVIADDKAMHRFIHGETDMPSDEEMNSIHLGNVTNNPPTVIQPKQKSNDLFKTLLFTALGVATGGATYGGLAIWDLLSDLRDKDTPAVTPNDTDTVTTIGLE